MARANALNSAGKSGIGPVANALQAFTFLARNKISRISSTPLTVNGIYLSEFKYINSAKKRVSDILSSILSVMTDNAKDPIAGKMGLSLEILSAFNYLISLGVSERDATLIINTPAVQMYAKILKENKYGIRTDAEKKGTKNEKINKIFKEILGEDVIFSSLKARYLNADIDTSLIENMIKDGINDSNREANALILVKFLQIEEEAKSVQDLSNLIKLTKGLPSSFTDVDKGMLDSLYKLGIAYKFGLPEKEDEEIKPAFWIGGAINDDALLSSNIVSALKVMGHASTIFVTETATFKSAFNKLLLNIRTNVTKDQTKELKRSFLGFITTNAYIKYMKTREVNPIANFSPVDNKLLFSELGGKTFARQLIELQNSPDESIKNNAFIRWLRPELKYNDLGEAKDKFAIFDKVSGKSFIKLSQESINDIVNSFQDLIANEKTKDFAINAFNYLLTKDNLEYRNDSFVKYIAPFMFNNVSKGLDLTLQEMLNGYNTTEFTNHSNEFRKILASYEPTQKNFIKKIKGDDLGITTFEESTKFISIKDGILTFKEAARGEFLDDLGFESKGIKAKAKKKKEDGQAKPVAEKVKEESTEEKMDKILDEINLFETDDIQEASVFINKVFDSVKNKAEAKKAYRKLSVKFHPDKNKSASAEEIFKLLNNANESYNGPKNVNIDEFNNYWKDFDVQSYGMVKGYKFPEFIVVKVGKVSKLFSTYLGENDEKWDTEAMYLEMETFGFPTTSPFNQDLKSSLDAWHIINNIKKEGETRSEKESNPSTLAISKIFSDEEGINFEDQNPEDTSEKNESDDKLDSSNKNIILDNKSTTDNIQEGINSLPNGEFKKELQNDLDNIKSEEDITNLIKKYCKGK